jgi:hypothetical protein
MCASVSREPIRITFHAIHAPNHSGSMPSTLHTVLDSMHSSLRFLFELKTDSDIVLPLN